MSNVKDAWDESDDDGDAVAPKRVDSEEEGSGDEPAKMASAGPALREKTKGQAVSKATKLEMKRERRKGDKDGLSDDDTSTPLTPEEKMRRQELVEESDYKNLVDMLGSAAKVDAKPKADAVDDTPAGASRKPVVVTLSAPKPKEATPTALDALSSARPRSPDDFRVFAGNLAGKIREFEGSEGFVGFLEDIFKQLVQCDRLGEPELKRFGTLFSTAAAEKKKNKGGKKAGGAPAAAAASKKGNPALVAERDATDVYNERLDQYEDDDYFM